MIRTYETCGREVMVKFTCMRCKRVEMRSYNAVMTKSADGNLHCSEVPEGWTDYRMDGLLCNRCSDKLKRFIGGVELDESR